jgi:AcrR family transcriptional regulator
MISKADVLAAASDLVDREGLDRLSLSAVAEALGIRTPSLYNHIEGLPGLRRDLCLSGLRELNAAISRATIGRECDEAVRAMAHAYRIYAHSRPGLYAATFYPLGQDDRQAAVDLLAIIVAVLNGYQLGQEGTLHAIRGLRSALHGFVSLEAAGQFAMPLDLDTSFDLLIETMIAGLRSADSSGVSARRC